MNELFHIIAVDDESDMNVLFKHFFRNEVKMNKVKLSFAASAKECLNILANDKHPFVKVITDINMPDVNGLDLANQIAQSYPEVEVFLISAYSKEDLGLVSELSKFKYIPKPIDFNELKRVINL